MEEIVVHATKSQVEEFKESILWADIVRELEAWRHGFDMEMKTIVDDAADSNPSTAAVLMHMGDINGRIKAIDYLLSIPDVFLEMKEEKDESKKED